MIASQFLEGKYLLEYEHFFENYRPSLFGRIMIKLKNLKWWIFHRFHPRHRYNIVHTGLHPGYYDKDYLMEACIIRLLFDFFDQEDPESMGDNGNRFTELRSLYEWFKENPQENLCATRYKDYCEFEKAEKLFTQKLTRVVELRGLMWT